MEITPNVFYMIQMHALQHLSHVVVCLLWLLARSEQLHRLPSGRPRLFQDVAQITFLYLLLCPPSFHSGYSSSFLVHISICLQESLCSLTYRALSLLLH